ncbi:hypothetical protein [Methylobacterium dankookense]|uniref:Bacteriophage tail tape measure N-terminal domain-containing protein n=1 Tax=Methylobacterium dankookense TaxID=560405 RepID=A0A564G3M3_9HYPH|nr:hypothetical protein [Methylobacterium dankookense]GJD58152.1 hypothetical protein IFDJLNFL_4067 [Methylobacterium dankookense]VUF15103.1 hypothetical protein MTDSW087_04836 [Methylobacterium dankookense]
MAGLTYSVGANITAFESAMSRVRDLAAKRSADMLTSFQGAARGIDVALAGVASLNRIPGALNTIKQAAQATVLAFVAFEGAKLAIEAVTAAASAATAEVDRLAKVGADAERLGVSTTFLQTYQGQARAFRVEVDELTKSLQMARNAFTLRQGDGGEDARNDSSFAARLRQQRAAGNLTAAQVARFDGAIGFEQQERVALDLIAELIAKGRQLAALDLAAKIFPPEIVDRIRQGTFEIDRFRQNLDNIRNPELRLDDPQQIARAQELQRRQEEANRQLADAGAAFNRQLADAGARLKEDAVAWTELMARGARAAVAIMQAVRRAGEEYNRGAGLSSGGPPSLGGELGAVATRGGQPQPTQEQREMQDAMNRLRGNLGNQTLVRQAQDASRALTDGFRKDLTKPIQTTRSPRSSSSSESLDAIETYINGLERSTAALRGEVDAIGKSNSERQIAINLQRAEELARQQNRELTADEVRRIRETSAATAEYRDKLEDVRETLENQRSTGRNVLSGIVSDARNGASALNVLTNAVNRLLDRLADQGVNTLTEMLFGKSGSTQGGLLGGLFGSSGSGGGTGLSEIFGFLTGSVSPIPRFAGGGYTGDGGRDTPRGVVHAGEVVFSQADVRRLGGVAAVEAVRRGLPGYAAGGPVGAVPSVRPALVGAAPINFIDQRPAGSPDIAPVAQRRSDGGLNVLIRGMEGELGKRAFNSQGPFRGVAGGAGSRIG